MSKEYIYQNFTAIAPYTDNGAENNYFCKLSSGLIIIHINVFLANEPDNNILFHLPIGFRPQAYVSAAVFVVKSESHTYGHLSVSEDGNVRITMPVYSKGCSTLCFYAYK